MDNKWLERLRDVETEEARFVIKTEEKTKQEIPYLSFSAFEGIEGVCAGFSTRLGGVSEGSFESMDLSFVRGDEEERVFENYRRILAALDLSENEVVFTDQVHESDLKVVGKADCRGLKEKILKTDGILTNEKKVALVTSFADCVPLFFVDPIRKVIASSHSGWKGTVLKIGAKTVAKMTEEFGCDREDIIVVIGPSICQDCYEVSEDVARAFLSLLQDPEIRNAKEAYMEYTRERPDIFRRNGKEGKYLLDLWKANQLVLLSAGVPFENIHVSGICTCCNPDIFFSHRATNGERGNLNGFLWMK